MRASLRFAVAILVVAAGAAVPAVASSAERGGGTTTVPADDVLYEDAAGHSSATITQVLPNSSTQNMTLENVRRISVKQGILVIEWGGTATTLLPRQFVSSISINRRNGTAAPATAPAPAR